MIGIDTNIIVRFLTQDDDVQYKKAVAIFKSNEIFIPDTVILETEWVLRFAYEFSTVDVCKAFKALFGLRNVHLAHSTQVAQAIEWHQNGLDFSDALHLSQCQVYNKLYTFDKAFMTKAKGLTGCLVVGP